MQFHPLEHALIVFLHLRGQPYVNAFETQLHCPGEQRGVGKLDVDIVVDYQDVMVVICHVVSVCSIIVFILTSQFRCKINVGFWKAASVDDEESSNGGDEDQASPSRRGSQAEFRQTSSSFIS